MTKKQLLASICPSSRIHDCENYHCVDCNLELIKWLDEYDKQIRADAIDEVKDKIVLHLNDYALQEAPIYQDDTDNQRPVYLAIKNCINGVIEIAEKLKGQKK